MKMTMVVPSYWRRNKNESQLPTDTVYDHPTPLDEEGTLGRLLKSLSILDNKDFNVVILGVANSPDIQEDVEQKLTSIIANSSPSVQTHLFSYSHLKKILAFLEETNREDRASLLKLDGYSNIRNLCLFIPHLLGSEVAVLIDDDEYFEDPLFMNKATEFIGRTQGDKKILAVAGYYINPDDDYLINKDISPWMIYWNKNDSMNRAFQKTIATSPRLKETTFAFGGNLLVHKELFTQIPFDPRVSRGEDIDFLMNARMFGFKVFLDNELSIKHDAPPKTFPLWQQVREDIQRFIFQKKKLETQESHPHMSFLRADDLDPYPGEFLKDDLNDRIFRSNHMLAIDYISQGNTEGALECMKNIELAGKLDSLKENPFQDLCALQKEWKQLMAVFENRKKAEAAASTIWRG